MSALLSALVAGAVLLSFGLDPPVGWRLAGSVWPLLLRVVLLFSGAALSLEQPGAQRLRVARLSLALAALLSGVGALWFTPSEVAGGAATRSLSVCGCLVGVGLLLGRERWSGLRQACLWPVTVVSLLLSLLPFEPAVTWSTAAGNAPALQPGERSLLAAGLLAISLAALLARPAGGFFEVLASETTSGLVSRRFLLAGVIFPLVAGRLCLAGEWYGLYDQPAALALFSVSVVIFVSGLCWATACRINRLEGTGGQVAVKLRQREQQLELLFEKSGVGDFTWDLITNQVAAHPSVFQMYGAEQERGPVDAEWFTERQHLDDRERVRRVVTAALADQQGLDIEFRVVLPDGEIRWISCRGKVLRDLQGRAVRTTGLNMDVTERHRAGAVLQQSLEQAREADAQRQIALTFAKVAAWYWKPDPDLITWLGPVEQVYGRSSEEMTNLSQFRAAVHPDDYPALEASLQSSLQGNESYVAEFRVLTKDGFRWLAGRGDVLRNASGEIYGMSGVNFDITAMKSSEASLRESERRFHDLADSMPQMVWSADARGEIDYLNQQWYAYTGAQEGASFARLTNPDDVPGMLRCWRQSIRSGAPFECEQRLWHAAGQTYRWHLSRARPIVDTEGTVSRWFGTTTDIDDYKCIQEKIQQLNSDLEQRVERRSAELAEVELRYRMLVEGIRDYAIFMLDTSGHVRTWNDGAEKLFGYSAQDAKGMHCSRFFTREAVRDGVPEWAMAEALVSGRHIEEGWRKRKNGEEFWASVVTMSLQNARGQMDGFAQVIRDMTENRHAMSLLVKEHQNAERANQAKSMFLASMSHEIRTPMNAILGMADLLSETELDDMQREYVRRFQGAGANLLSIINDLLDLSKIESGYFELEEVPFDLEELTQRVVELIAPKAHAKRINLACRLVPGLELNLVGDPHRLQQILLNLLGNAVKFTETGEVLLTVRRHASGRPGHVHFEVCDTGIGIAPDKIATVFDDFIQAESSTTRRFGGTGLGLGIAKRLVERMRGSLTVRSMPGHGSTFIFDAQFQRRSAAVMAEGLRRAPESGNTEALAGRRILIVDQAPNHQLIYREMCSLWKMRSEVTESARQAIGWLREAHAADPFALVLLDRFSSDLNAFDAFAEIRNAWPALPVLLTTAEDQVGDATRAMAAGFAGYLIKPIRRAHLLGLLVSSLRQVAPSVEPRPLETPTAPPRVLVVEDSEDNRFLIEAYLTGSRYVACFAHDGQTAIEKFSGESFDLVLMDIEMPVMDGLKATAAMRALEKQVGRRPTPIIALTGNAFADDVDKCRGAGCDGHLSKPISRNDLLRVMDECQMVRPASGPETIGLEPIGANQAGVKAIRVNSAGVNSALP